MKKVFLGASALGVALAAVAFTNAPKKGTSTEYYFQLTVNGATTPIPISSTPPTTLPTGFGCSSGSVNCAADFTSYTLTTGQTKYTSSGTRTEIFYKRS